MELDTITMDPDEARERFEAYRGEVREHHRREDAEIATGYAELMKGRQLIRLAETIAAGGLDGQLMPRLAVARADLPWCYLIRGATGAGHLRATFVGAADRDEAWRVSAWDRRFSATLDLPNPHNGQVHTSLYEALRSHVPVVPPEHRPTGRSHLGLFHVLWEVEKWEADPVPPVDPALIRRVGGDLWAVHAVWDLTELERAVLAGRR